MQKKHVVAFVAFLICVSTVVVAQTVPAGFGPPNEIPYQGRLELNGIPVEGQETLTFFLAESQGAAYGDGIWEEVHTVTLRQGRFSVMLGENNPFDDDTFARGALYVGMVVNGVELPANQRIGRTPYAIEAVSGVPVGTIVPFAGAAAPSGWLLCNGGTHSSADYPRLATVLGTTYGNPGGGNFTVPNLSNRYPIGAGDGVSVGALVGSNDATHDHDAANPGEAGLRAHVGIGWNGSNGGIIVERHNDLGLSPSASFTSSYRMPLPSGHPYGPGTDFGSPATIVSGTTGTAAVDNRPASLGLNYIIKW